MLYFSTRASNFALSKLPLASRASRANLTGLMDTAPILNRPSVTSLPVSGSINGERCARHV
nr:MAG TPA: hypothetical protein [Caudoviricetes sp.]